MAMLLSDGVVVAVKPVVVAMLERAERFARAGELEHAASFFRAAVAADTTPVARVAYGVFLVAREREIAGRNQLLEAWEMAKRSGDGRARAIVCHNLAALHRRMGQTSAAESYQQLAIRASLDADPCGQLPGYVLSGRALDLASREPEVAEDLFISAGTETQESVAADLNRGVLAYRRGAIEDSRKLLHAAFEAAQSSEDYETCAAALTNLAHLKREQGHWSTADECLALAQRIHERAGRSRSTLRQMQYRRELKRGLVLLGGHPEWN